jgi:hypothetical protein
LQHNIIADIYIKNVGKSMQDHHTAPKPLKKYLATPKIIKILKETGIDLPTEKMMQFVTKLYDLQNKEDQQVLG